MSDLVQLSVDELAEAFYDENIKEELKGATLYISIYEQAYYEGYALVVWEKNGELFLVEGSHCSCYGLEGQWNPEKTDWRALEKRQFFGYDEIQEALKAFTTEKSRLVGVQV
jgi:hypothetical protein